MPRRLAALGLVAWLAGAGCLLNCSAAISAHAAPSQAHAAPAESHSSAQPDSCAAMSGHDCCAGGEEKKAERAAAGPESHRGRTAMHCPLGRHEASDPARKVRVETTPAASAPATRSPAPAPAYVAPARAAGVPARDRGSTYLRCCVFLI